MSPVTVIDFMSQVMRYAKQGFLTIGVQTADNVHNSLITSHHHITAGKLGNNSQTPGSPVTFYSHNTEASREIFTVTTKM